MIINLKSDNCIYEHKYDDNNFVFDLIKIVTFNHDAEYKDFFEDRCFGDKLIIDNEIVRIP